MKTPKTQVGPVVALWIAATLAAGACTSREAGSSGAPAGEQPPASDGGAPRRYKVGFANLTEGVPFCVRVREGIVSAAKDAGDIDLVLADNKLDGPTALTNAESFITQGVDGVIEFQTDERFGNVIMDRLRSKEIPVVAIDIPMPGATFFGVDNYKAGRMAGEFLGDRVKARWAGAIDALVMLELPQSGPIPAARMQGLREGIEAKVGKVDEAKVKHLDSKNTLEEARRLVLDVLTTLPDARHVAIVSINDDTALGAIAAAEAAGRTNDILVAGQGADERGRAELRKPDSPLVATTAYSPELYGKGVIPVLRKLLKKEPVPPAVYMDHRLVTKENVRALYPSEGP